MGNQKNNKVRKLEWQRAGKDYFISKKSKGYSLATPTVFENYTNNTNTPKVHRVLLSVLGISEIAQDIRESQKLARTLKI